MKKLTLKQIRLILIIILITIYTALEISIGLKSNFYFENLFLEVSFYLLYLLKGIIFYFGILFLCDYLAHKITHTKY